MSTSTHEPRLARQHSKTALNPLGKPLVIHVQGACTCGWRGVAYSLHSSIEGWDLGVRDALDHATSANRTEERSERWVAVCEGES